ncbi:hypothetical protein EYF80_000710 [Liparis tanakae]|uniref:Uncharacterized protein n=1 Tax=Liparis tanakae TaxID=230148 RepID=A0A4Z2JHU0_9TELE|nr:hypothetical protein EYF80_000710 [Liparis tanakae]
MLPESELHSGCRVPRYFFNEAQSLERAVSRSSLIYHTCWGRSTCELWVQGDAEAEAKSTASLRHLEGEETLKQVHTGLHTCQHLIRSSYTLQQSEIGSNIYATISNRGARSPARLAALLHHLRERSAHSQADLGLSSGSSLATAVMSWVLRAWSIEPVCRPSRQNPATGLLAVSLPERTLSSRMSPPSTTPNTSTPSNS